jgi:ketosteroid isomerase-like protein
MSQENVELVRQGYEALAKGDFERLFVLFDPEIELDVSRRHIDPGIFHGHEGIREFRDAQRDVWSDQRIEPEEYIDAGDAIVVPIRPPIRLSIPRVSPAGSAACNRARAYTSDS